MDGYIENAACMRLIFVQFVSHLVIGGSADLMTSIQIARKVVNFSVSALWYHEREFD
jgi:hypothetical protein